MKEIILISFMLIAGVNYGQHIGQPSDCLYYQEICDGWVDAYAALDAGNCQDSDCLQQFSIEQQQGHLDCFWEAINCINGF